MLSAGFMNSLYAEADIKQQADAQSIDRNSIVADPALAQYLATALWSTTDESTPEGGEPMDSNYDLEDLDPDVVEKARKNIEDFKKAAEGTGYEEFWDDSQLGHDLILTQNGHGAGLWDRYLDFDEATSDRVKAIGDQLTEIAKGLGEFQLYVGDDKKIHASLKVKAEEPTEGCDHGHPGESYRLPTGGDGAALLCREHWASEMEFRKERNLELDDNAKFDILPYPGDASVAGKFAPADVPEPKTMETKNAPVQEQINNRKAKGTNTDIVFEDGLGAGSLKRQSGMKAEEGRQYSQAETQGQTIFEGACPECKGDLLIEPGDSELHSVGYELFTCQGCGEKYKKTKVDAAAPSEEEMAGEARLSLVKDFGMSQEESDALSDDEVRKAFSEKSGLPGTVKLNYREGDDGLNGETYYDGDDGKLYVSIKKREGEGGAWVDVMHEATSEGEPLVPAPNVEIVAHQEIKAMEDFDVTVYDSGSEQFDRYTIVIKYPETGEDYWFGASEDPFHPQGFGQGVGDSRTNGEPGPHLGEIVEVSTLPEKVQQYITQLTKEEEPVNANLQAAPPPTSRGGAPQREEMTEKAREATEVKRAMPKTMDRSKGGPKSLKKETTDVAPEASAAQSQALGAVITLEGTISEIQTQIKEATKELQEKLKTQKSELATAVEQAVTLVETAENQVIKYKDQLVAVDSAREVKKVNLSQAAQKKDADIAATIADLNKEVKEFKEEQLALQLEQFKKHGGEEIESPKLSMFPASLIQAFLALTSRNDLVPADFSRLRALSAGIGDVFSAVISKIKSFYDRLVGLGDDITEYARLVEESPDAVTAAQAALMQNKMVAPSVGVAWNGLEAYYVSDIGDWGFLPDTRVKAIRYATFDVHGVMIWAQAVDGKGAIYAGLPSKVLPKEILAGLS